MGPWRASTSDDGRNDLANLTIRKQLLQLARLNQGHRFSLSRDSLVAMLDRALAEVK